MREHNTSLTATGAQIVAIAPHSLAETIKFQKSNQYPFDLLPDEDGKVFEAYDVTSRLMSLGQQPALFVVDRTGQVRFDAIGNQQWDLVGPDRLAEILAALNKP